MQFRALAIVIAVLSIGGVTAFSRAESVQHVGKSAPVVFVCRNGVSMSVWSAAYFNRLALRDGLPQRATSRSAHSPFPEVPLRMRVALAIDGFRLGEYQPRQIDAGDARDAELVVVIEGGTTLPSDVRVLEHATIERWQGFPAMRDEYFASRSELRGRVETLVARLSAARSGPR
jgi:hypothetical protein